MRAMKLPPRLSPKGIALLTTLEGSRSRAYRDAAQHWTIGIGHLIVLPSETGLLSADLTPGEIKALLHKDLEYFERSVFRACINGGVTPTQSQFDAFVLLAFNIGLGGKKRSGFLTSTTLRRFLNHDHAGAASAFLMWNKITVGGKKLSSKALEARRIAESRAFLHGYYDKTPYNSLDDDEKIKAMIIPSNSIDNPTSIVPSQSEARPSLKSSRTMKATVIGQSGSGLVGAAATAGLAKSIVEQTKSAADTAGQAVRSVGDAVTATSETAGVLSGVSIWIYMAIFAGAIIAISSFIFVRRARRDDWRRGWR